jgi:heme exporter protein D
METVAEFLAMGGYAKFVWPAYGLTAMVMGWLVFVSRRRLHAAQAEVEALEAAAALGRQGKPEERTL